MGRHTILCTDKVITPAENNENAILQCQKLRDHPDSHQVEETNGKTYIIHWENKN